MVSEALHEARKALMCLYLAAEESVADDVHKKVEAAFAALSPTWATAQPTKPGWYFFRRYPNDHPIILTVGLGMDTVSWPGGLAVDYLYNVRGEWAGPLEVPQ